MPFVRRNRRTPTEPIPVPDTSAARTRTMMPPTGYDAQAAALRPPGAPGVQAKPADVDPTKNPEAILAEPQKHGVGVLAAATAVKMDRDIERQIDERGYSDYTGTQSGETERNGQPLHKTDCTTYVIEVLASAFRAAGRTDDWSKVLADARRASGAGGLKGTELMKSLQRNLGWVGVFWAPDSKSSDPEHSYSAYKARTKGSYYGIQVDRDKLVTDYRPEDPSRTPNLSGLQKLQRINFGVLAARGGMHMAMIIRGNVYEVHWAADSTDKNLIEVTPLKDWAWMSGAIVMPPEEAARWNQLDVAGP